MVLTATVVDVDCLSLLMPLPLTVSCFSKIQIGFTFLVPAHPGSPGHRAVKRVCVCVCVTCKLTAKNRDQLRNPTLGNRVWASFFNDSPHNSDEQEQYSMHLQDSDL